MGITLFTFQDAIDHVVDYLGANPTKESYRDARRAVLSAYREVASAHRWTYFYSRGRLNSVASQTTGTVAYSQSTLTVTLTGATWPTWAPYGQIVLGQVVYQVASNPTLTTITLSVSSNPGADVAAGSTYTLYRDTYPLPTDFLAAEEFINTNNYLRLCYEHPRAWLSYQRILHSPAVPHVYTLRGDPHYFGAMAVSFFPPPDQVYHFDFLYQRRPRPLLVDSYSTGNASVTNGSAAVVGSGSTWTSKHVGSSFRAGPDAVTAPTGLVGLNPFVEEKVVSSVTDGTDLVADSTFSQTLSNVLYVISDPVDIEEGAMLTCFLRCLEKQVAIDKKMKDRADINKAYQDELIRAREADSRSFARRVEGQGRSNLIRLRDFPRGADVS